MWGYVDRPDLPVHLRAVVSVLSFTVPTLFLLGLTGLYVWREGRVDRLGEAGLIVALVGAGLGVVHGLSSVTSLASSIVRNSWPPRYGGFHYVLHDVWLPIMLAGLTLVGLASVGQGRLRRAGALALAMGASGWLYFLTDSGAMLKTRVLHVGFGLLFSVGWIALGLALWARSRSGTRELES